MGSHPSADLDACALRNIVLANACADVPDYSELVDRITMAGSLQHIGGGVHRRVHGDLEQRLLATVLQPEPSLPCKTRWRRRRCQRSWWRNSCALRAREMPK